MKTQDATVVLNDVISFFDKDEIALNFFREQGSKFVLVDMKLSDAARKVSVDLFEFLQAAMRAADADGSRLWVVVR